jgi:hypothetical protein
MKVLFDFELDESLPHRKNDFLYEKIRNFFASRYTPLEKEIESYLNEDEVFFVLLCMDENTLKAVPYNVPPSLSDAFRQCVTHEDFNAFQDELMQRNKHAKPE